MGYNVMFYAVDLPKLRLVFGGRDKELLQTILRDRAEDIEGEDDDCEDEIAEDGWATMKEVLKQIFSGKINAAEGSEYRYGYALKMICEHIGRFVSGDVADVRNVPFPTALMRNGPPIPIPPSDDFPEIGHLSAEEVRTELAALAEVPPSEDEEINEEIEGFRDALAEAANVGLGLVAFRH